MQPESRAGSSLLDRVLRFTATFTFTAGAVMAGTMSTRFGTWEPWGLALIGATLFAWYFYRQPVEGLRNTRTGEPLFDSTTHRNIVFGAFLIVMFVVLFLIGRLIALAM